LPIACVVCDALCCKRSEYYMLLYAGLDESSDDSDQ
jgi:hypothetical protein